MAAKGQKKARKKLTKRGRGKRGITQARIKKLREGKIENPTDGEICALWIEEHCRCPEGAKVGRPLLLAPAQWDILKGIYDSETHTAIISFGRKNGKSTLCAAIVLLHLVGPAVEPNAQLYSSATSREQAAVTFNLALKMVRMEPRLNDFIQVRESAKQLLCPQLGTIYIALSAEDKTAHGLSPRVVIHDELGQVSGPRSALFDALETGSGAHTKSLSVIISTQAKTDSDLLSILIDDAQRGEDSGVKLFFWTADKEADPWSEATWKAANPLYGVSLQPAYVKRLADRARRMPSQENAFRNLVLNQRVDASSLFIPGEVWKTCKQAPDPELLRAFPIYAGLDLSARADLTALVYGVEAHGVWHVWAKFFAPKVGIHDRALRDRVPYDAWAADGWIDTPDSASVDYAHVAMALVDLAGMGELAGIAFDRWRIDVLKRELDRLGIELPLIQFGQGFRDMSPALDELEAALGNTRIRHGGNPVLTWNASNAITVEDPAGNRKLDKKRATGRIDGIVALAMMLGSRAKEPEQPKASATQRASIYNIGAIA